MKCNSEYAAFPFTIYIGGSPLLARPHFIAVLYLIPSQDDDNRKIVETAVSTFGGLHVSFINAGAVTLGSITDVTEERIDDQFGPNFKGVVFGLKHQVQQQRVR